MSTTPTRRTRLLAGFGAAVVTVVVIVAASFGYNTWRSGSDGQGTTAPTTTEPASPEYEPDGSEGEPTKQTPPEEAETTDQDSPADGDGSDEQETPDDKSAEPGADAEAGPPAWSRVLDGFARDFNQVKGSKKEWRSKMARWVTPHLAQAYRTVDPRQLPNTTIARTEIQSSGSEAVTAIIHYRGIQPVWVLLRPTADGWRVTEAEPYTGG